MKTALEILKTLDGEYLFEGANLAQSTEDAAYKKFFKKAEVFVIHNELKTFMESRKQFKNKGDFYNHAFICYFRVMSRLYDTFDLNQLAQIIEETTGKKYFKHYREMFNDFWQ